jgi:hypothetical protein
MPGFFESLKRMAQGKPVFDSNDDSAGWADKNGNARDVQQQPDPEQQTQQPQASQPQQPQGRADGVIKGQASTFPVVVVKRTRTQLSGTNQAVYCSIVNRSKVAVELKEVRLAGSSRRLSEHLRPGEEREWLCYNGPRQSSESYKEASLDYMVEITRDDFQSIYDVEYQYGSDKTYSVEELHWRQPIRDING